MSLPKALIGTYGKDESLYIFEYFNFDVHVKDPETKKTYMLTTLPIGSVEGWKNKACRSNTEVIIDMYKRGTPVTEIAAKCHVSSLKIYQLLREYKVELRQKYHPRWQVGT